MTGTAAASADGRVETTPSITGPAGRLHVDDGGSGGPPVVFVHSFAGSSAHWASQLAHLRPRRRAGAKPEGAARLRGEMESLPRATSIALIRATFAYDPRRALKA